MGSLYSTLFEFATLYCLVWACYCWCVVDFLCVCGKFTDGMYLNSVTISLLFCYTIVLYSWALTYDMQIGSDWVLMNTTEAMSYFTPYEVCMLSTHGDSVVCDFSAFDPADNFLPSCQAHIGNFSLNPGPRECFNTFNNMYRHASTQPWPKSHNWIDVIKIMKQHESDTLVMIGDSLTGQNYVDMLCASHRYGLQANWGNSLAPASTYFYTQDPKDSADSMMKPKPDFPYFQVHFYFTGGRDGDVSRVATKVHNSFFVPNPRIKSSSGRKVFLMNIGVHFNSDGKEAYRHAVRSMINLALHYIKQNHIVIYRETTAQHFTTPTGSYSQYAGVLKRTTVKHVVGNMSKSLLSDKQIGPESKEVFVPPSGCIPLQDPSDNGEQNWRNRIAKEELQHMDPEGLIHFIPFYRITADRHDFHTDSHDCTHYCGAPMMWLPLYDQLANILADAYAKNATRPAFAAFSAKDALPDGVELVGRFLAQEGVHVADWSGSAVRMRVLATGVNPTVTLRLEADSTLGKYFVGTIVDCSESIKFEVTNSNLVLSLPLTSAQGSVHEITFMKISEAHGGDSTGHMLVAGVEVSNGRVLAASEPQHVNYMSSCPKKHKLLFIGDSLTAAYGVDGIPPCSFSASVEDFRHSYAHWVSMAVGADVQAVAWSGKGVVRNFGDANTTSIDPLPFYYNRTVATMDTVYDSSKYAADMVLVMLGINDYSTFPQPSDAAFTNGLVALLQQIKHDYKTAKHVITICAPYNDDNKGKQCANTEAAARATGAYYVLLPKSTWQTNGCDSHPDQEAQKKMAAVVIPIVSKLLKA